MFIYICICVLQEEKEVLALLSRLDAQNVHFTNSPPGMLSSKYCFLLGQELDMYFISFLAVFLRQSAKPFFPMDGM